MSGGDARATLLAQAETAVVERLRDLDVGVQVAALDALAVRGAITDAEPVWRVALAGEVEMDVRAKAFHCLERLRCADAARARAAAAQHPCLRYFLARYLVACGDRAGVDMLLELVDGGTAAWSAEEPRRMQEVVMAARQLLARLSATNVQAGVDAWRQWAASAVLMPATAPLPEPRITF